MPNNFIIWTMQRSGGTSLTRLLANLGPYRNVKHEPFNGNQSFGYVLKDLQSVPGQTDKIKHISDKIEQIYSTEKNLCIKHCYEIHSDWLNQKLVSLARDKGLVSIVLTRKCNFERSVSLELAKQTGSWSKEQFDKSISSDNTANIQLPKLDIERMIKHESVCVAKQAKVIGMLAHESDVFEICYEDLYSDTLEKRLNQLWPCFRALNISTQFDSHAIEFARTILMHQKQNTQNVYSNIPNYEEAKLAFGRLNQQGRKAA